MKLLSLFLILMFPLCALAVDYSNDANIVGYWPMENDASDAETEQSGNGTDLTVSAGDSIPNSVDKQVGAYSRDLQGGGGLPHFYQADGLSTDINGADQTISGVCWIKPSSIGTTDTVISKYLFTNGSHQYMAYLASGVPYVKIANGYSGSPSAEAIGGTTLGTGTWYHFGWVSNDTDIKIYIDGSLDSNGSDNPKAYTGGIWDGGAQFKVGDRQANIYVGLIDDVAMFDRDITAIEISDIKTCGVDGSLCAATARRVILVN